MIMDAIYFHPAGHKHHFRNVEPEDGKADLRDDEGKLIYAAVPVSAEPKDGHCVITGDAITAKQIKAKP
jgi:hypothetical protein